MFVDIEGASSNATSSKYLRGYARFLETDPIGYGDGLNWYNYVGGDPINFTDPTGLFCADGASGSSDGDCAGHGGYVDGSPRDQPQVTVIVNGGGSDSSPPVGSLPTGPSPTIPKVTVLPDDLSSGVDVVVRGVRPTKPIPPEVKRYICRLLGNSGYNVPKAWAQADQDRKSKINGVTSWNNPTLRAGENWLYAAGWGPNKLFIYLHQYGKYDPFFATSPFSQEALDAGLDGNDHYDQNSTELQEYCSEE